MNELILLSWSQVALVASLIIVNAAISFALQLRLERTLAWASLRTVLQLFLIGMILQWVLSQKHWSIVLMLAAVMTGIAGYTAASRSKRTYPGIWLDTLVSVWASSWIICGVALSAVTRGSTAWYDPQYAIPLLGMILGNTLNGIALGINTFSDSLQRDRGMVETALCLGATRWEAARPHVQEAVRTGLIPIINAMLIVGVVSLPGMMTGQILSGTPPHEAVKYQIVIMFLISAATGLGTIAAILCAYRRLFNQCHQYLHNRLTLRGK